MATTHRPTWSLYLTGLRPVTARSHTNIHGSQFTHEMMASLNLTIFLSCWSFNLQLILLILKDESSEQQVVGKSDLNARSSSLFLHSTVQIYPVHLNEIQTETKFSYISVHGIIPEFFLQEISLMMPQATLAPALPVFLLPSA